MKLAISPCPNDTYIFHRMITASSDYEPVYLDIQELNENARHGAFELTKLSCFAYLKLKDQYTMLDAGGALGRGCGPLLVSSSHASAEGDDLLDLLQSRQMPILIPGQETTASLMLRMYIKSRGLGIPLEFMRYDRILPALRDGSHLAGVIIHEERFTYPSFGARLIQDLGQWWESATGSPIPLGLIALRNDLLDQKESINRTIQESLEYANTHPDAGKDFIKSHAQAMDESAIADHIALYVNDYSLDMGEEGRRAMEELERRARAAGAL
ncbi:MAG: 1,4-dihydroxy-6-naphthoate synthase [Leptospiraceae bacterium]|nr:1,4-dihydroxy-6-naphthoate synthase [Leptospiraceae bacterium]